MKLSIITINYNNRDGLRKTIESVVAQTTRNFEYIVIDGGSTDGSVDVIKEYADYIDYWVSEPDKGIYNAMNKGVAVAHGEYCQFLNSGDWLYDETVVDSFLKLDDNSDIILGKSAYIMSDRIHIIRNIDNDISLIDMHLGGLNHQSSFIRTDLCRKRPYDETYKVCSDWKFFIETIIINNCTFSVINNIIVYYDTNGISSIKGGLYGRERGDIMTRLIPPRILSNYGVLDKETYEIAKLLHPYQGLKRAILKLIKFITSLYGKSL